MLDLFAIKQRFGIIGNSEPLNRAIEMAVKVAQTDLTVLITGESGVGKEYFPQIIHTNSVRKHGKYFAVNCGAIPEGTIDSELFGHVKGAFIDAVSERKGYLARPTAEPSSSTRWASCPSLHRRVCCVCSRTVSLCAWVLRRWKKPTCA